MSPQPTWSPSTWGLPAGVDVLARNPVDLESICWTDEGLPTRIYRPGVWIDQGLRQHGATPSASA